MSRVYVYELTVINKDTEFTVEEKVIGWTVHSGAIEILYENGVVQVFTLSHGDNEKSFQFTPVKE